MPIEYDTEDRTEGATGEKEKPAETALLPKSLLMGKEVKPGAKITLEVTHIYEDEVEVAYPKKTPMEESGDELDKMARPEFGGELPPAA